MDCFLLFMVIVITAQNMTLEKALNMNLKQFFIAISALFITLSPSLLSASSSKDFKEKIIFGGGPGGGTFQAVANAIHSFNPIKDATGFKVQVQPSEGSVENLKKIDAATLQMGIVYAGDLWRGTNGKMDNYAQDASIANSSSTTSFSPPVSTSANSTTIYSKVMAIASLYTASAQLVVHAGLENDKSDTTTGADAKNSTIKSIKDLEGKKIGVGNTGSGAYSTCELFLTHLGLWDKIEKRGIGYNDAVRAFKNSEIDAFWVFSALPCPAVAMAAEGKGAASVVNKSIEEKTVGAATNRASIEILNLGDDADKSGFLKEFPWFSTSMIKGGTYKGVEVNTLSFQDYAIWVASSEVSADVVYQMLSIIYTDEGLKYLAEQNATLKEMSIETGIIGIITPLHPGAERFWKDKGIIK